MFGKVMGSISMNFMPMILYTVKILLVLHTYISILVIVSHEAIHTLRDHVI